MCPGHSPFDKYPDCLTEALYGGMFDAETGTVDGFGYWVGLVIQAEAETVDGGEGVEVVIPAGTCLTIVENDRGHLTVTTYDTAEEAQTAFDDWEERFGAYLDSVDTREARITSSTGKVGW